MKRLRKVVSLLLACSMIAGSTVTTALAASPTDEISEREIRNAELSRSVAAQGMVCWKTKTMHSRFRSGVRSPCMAAELMRP